MNKILENFPFLLWVVVATHWMGHQYFAGHHTHVLIYHSSSQSTYQHAFMWWEEQSVYSYEEKEFFVFTLGKTESDVQRGCGDLPDAHLLLV